MIFAYVALAAGIALGFGWISEAFHYVFDEEDEN